MDPDDWIKMETEDLKGAINDGLSVEEATEILGRSDVEEVRNKGINVESWD